MQRGGVALGSATAALVLVVAFDAGGSFPDTTAFLLCGLLAALALRIVLADAPLAGWGRPVSAAAGTLAALAAWAMLSAAWSHAPVRAGDAAVRAAVYALVLLVFAAPAGGPDRLRWVARGVAVAFGAIGTAALATQLAPGLFPTEAGVLQDRLAFPLTYWNALGLLAGLGLVVLSALASDEREPLAGRALAAGALPVLACTLYFTFSRGAIAVTLLALAVLLVLAWGPGLAATALAVAAPVAAAVALCAASDALARPGRVGDAKVAAVVTVCAIVAGAARTLMARGPEARLRVPRLRRGHAVVALALVAVVGVAAVVHAGGTAGGTTDLRSRLTSTSSSERTSYWHVALDAARDAPLGGTGAGTFELRWLQERPRPARVQYAHSLYLETLGELGLVGLALLAASLVLLLRAVARLVRGADRLPAAALLAAGLAWALHAAVDWDWQVPAVTLWLPAAAGVALARPGGGGAAAWRPPLGVRALAGAVLVAAAFAPWQLAASERRLEAALSDYDTGDCASARAQADAGLVRRPGADIVLGVCRARAGLPGAEAALRAAAGGDPQSPEPYLALAEVRAARGQDPRPALREAQLRDPLEPALAEAAAPGASVADVPLVIGGIDRPAVGRVRQAPPPARAAAR